MISGICYEVLIGKKGEGRKDVGIEKERRREERQNESCKILITFYMEMMQYLWVCCNVHLVDVFMIKVLKA